MLKHFMSSLFNRIFHSRLLFALTLALIFYGLFLAPSDAQASRAWGEIWNLGHIGAFLIVWTFIFRLFPRFTRMSPVQLAVVVMMTTLVTAELIEIVQSWIGRDDEWQDVWDSGVGALLALGFSAVQIKALAPWPRTAWRAISLIALVLVPWTIWSNLADSVIVQRQFPVLCNFTTPFEMTRWHRNHAKLHLQSAHGGQAYLAVEFLPGRYSTITLKYFHRDWRGYKQLVLDVTNPEKQAYRVVLRIHDRWHKQHHFAYSDRFHRTLVLQPGRQHIVIHLADVANAPKTRKMDMQYLQALGLFTMDASSYHHLYIHRLYLE